MGGSETYFLLLLLLLAKGYTVTRGRLPVSCSIKLTIFMCSYVVTYVAIFIYESVVRNKEMYVDFLSLCIGLL